MSSSLLFSSPLLSLRAPLSTSIRATTATASVCAQCRRSFVASAVLSSGHNKWSKIKHEKAAADKVKNKQRNIFAKQLTLYSKMYGPDLNMNAQLAAVIAAAKKTGMPKSSIDAAIARGQGKSETGASLETAMFEVMLPPSVAMVVDIETDNKVRSIKDLRSIAKKAGGTATPTAFLFERKGLIVIGEPEAAEDADESVKKQPMPDFDDIMMQALEAGADDVEKDDEGECIAVWTQPNTTHQVAQTLAKMPGLNILSTDIIWNCTSDNVKVDDKEEVAKLTKLVTAIREYPDVQAVYMNAERGDSVSEEEWSAIEEALDS